MLWLNAAAGEPATLDIEVQAPVSTTAVPRFGVNLGGWTWWGAEQLARNVLKNPGFEGLIDRAIVIVRHAGQGSFTDDNTWTARPDGFWAGAGFDVRTGAAAGQRGQILDSRAAGHQGLPTFTVAAPVPALQPGDVVALTRISDSAPPTHWWLPPEVAAAHQVRATDQDRRPGSPGRRAVILEPLAERPAVILSYLDGIGERAGKLLPVEGRWRLSFWARAAGGSPALTVVFRRHGAPPLVQETLQPGLEWRLFTFDFTGQDAGPPGKLELRFQAAGDGGSIRLDDAVLEAVEDPPFPFRAEVIEVLEKLRPGYLRDWQGQLGETLENWLAEPFARRASRYRPGETQALFGYSLPEFLILCRRLGALPWLVVPTTFSDEEFERLGDFLRERIARDRFSELLVEFGNENWNSVFRPAGIADPEAHGQPAARAFRRIRAGAGPAAPLRLVVGGQYVNPHLALRTLKAAAGADILAVAPYFLHSLSVGKVTAEPWHLLFQDDGHWQPLTAGASALDKELAVYEVNLHTVKGDAPPARRDPLTAGAAAGSALAWRLLDALRLGVRRQCVYVLAQYDTRLAEMNGFVRLWGIVRDLGPTRRLRPTGLAVALLNQALGGDQHAAQITGADPAAIRFAAFRQPGGWTAAAVSGIGQPREVVVTFPALAAPLPRRLLELHAPEPGASNEAAEQVRIVEHRLDPADNRVRFTLPGWGLVVLLP